MGRNSRNGSLEDSRDISALLAEQEASGLSVAAFARAHGLDPQTFYNWRSETRRVARALSRAEGKAVPFLEATVMDTTTCEPPHLLVRLPCGVEAEVTSHDQLPWVAELARLLEGAD